MFAVRRGASLSLVRRVRGVTPAVAGSRRDLRLSRPAGSSEDIVWPWPWWEKPLPSQVTEKKIEWTPVLVITNISVRTGYQRAETKISWWRTECDG